MTNMFNKFSSSRYEDDREDLVSIDISTTYSISTLRNNLSFRQKLLLLACTFLLIGLIMVTIASSHLASGGDRKINQKIKVEDNSGISTHNWPTSTEVAGTPSGSSSTAKSDTHKVSTEKPKISTRKTCTSDICKEVALEMKYYMDENYDPCTNFFKYSCGGWIKNHTIPEGTPSVNIITEINLENKKTIQKILETYDEDEEMESKEVSENKNGYYLMSEYKNKSKEYIEEFNRQKKSEAGKKAHDFYISCVNKSDNESDPFEAWIEKWFGNQTDETDENWSMFQKSSKNPKMFSAFFTLKKVHHHVTGKGIIQVVSGGLTLPLNYYLEENNEVVDYLEYLTQLTESIMNSDQDVIRRNVESVIEFEKNIALITPTGSLDEKHIIRTIKEMQETFPYISWQEYFESVIGLPKDEIENLKLLTTESVLKYFKDLQILLTQMLADEDSRETVDNYLQWHFMKSKMRLLKAPKPKSLVLQNALGLEDEATNATEIDISFKCAEETHFGFPDVMGRLFVLETITRERFEAIFKAYEGLFETYNNMVKDLPWMDEKSKAGVLEMFANLTFANGFLPSVMDKEGTDARYKDLEITNNSYSKNVANLIDFQIVNELFSIEIEIINANAFFINSQNKILVLAGIERKPFFDFFYPTVINYARLGFTMGHEMTHAFQAYCNKGREEHDEGIDDPILSLDSYNHFISRRNCVEELYSGFRINAEFHINGSVTLEENFADVAGLQVAYKSYVDNYWKDFENLPGLESFTQSQIFFIAAAQSDCRKVASGDEGDKELKTELFQQHSPDSIRVVGEMTNNKDFAKAFQCPVGTLYNLKDKCEIFN